ncbi:MAG: hypothetical protein KDD89_06940, partial [Anaerolineales bacterium]|nr:hypothetical protein [Anaerolineales bacterium]
MTQPNRTCPQCNAQMSFSGDGRALVCDRCDYRQDLNVDAKRPTLADFRETQRLGHFVALSNARGVLRQG